MTALKLGHYSIRTSDLEASRRFYVEVIGLRAGYRPPFSFPGLWLYGGEDAAADYGLVHLIGEDAATNDYLGGRAPAASASTGRFDHIAFLATGWAALRQRCRAHGVPYVERTVPSLGQHQVFLSDPSGITIEMNYSADEAGV